jgi:hypothetical protein
MSATFFPKINSTGELHRIHNAVRGFSLFFRRLAVGKRPFIWKELTIQFDGRAITGSYAEWKGLVIVNEHRACSTYNFSG